MLGELGGLAEVAADEGGVEAAARGGREAERGGRRGVRGAVCGGLRGGGLRGGVHGGALLYAGSGRRALVRGRAAVFAGDVFFWADAGARRLRGGCAAAARRLRGGLGEPQRLRRLRGWRYLGWFRHGICGESRGCGGGEALARAGVSGVRVAGAGLGLLATG